jgi:hypothetical protein
MRYKLGGIEWAGGGGMRRTNALPGGVHATHGCLKNPREIVSSSTIVAYGNIIY